MVILWVEVYAHTGLGLGGSSLLGSSRHDKLPLYQPTSHIVPEPETSNNKQRGNHRETGKDGNHKIKYQKLRSSEYLNYFQTAEPQRPQGLSLSIGRNHHSAPQAIL